jgi:hypothetical protein
VIINAKDYAGRNAAGGDPWLRELIRYVGAHYVEVDAYRGPEPRTAPISQILDFAVLQKRSAADSPTSTPKTPGP